eukprot:15331969-Ditylum_brightwellii.AAC.1
MFWRAGLHIVNVHISHPILAPQESSKLWKEVLNDFDLILGPCYNHCSAGPSLTKGTRVTGMSVVSWDRKSDMIFELCIILGNVPSVSTECSFGWNVPINFNDFYFRVV